MTAANVTLVVIFEYGMQLLLMLHWYENVLKRRECLSFSVIEFDDYDGDLAIVIIISALQWLTSTFHFSFHSELLLNVFATLTTANCFQL